MKNLLFLLVLTSCSFNDTAQYWTEELNTKSEKIDYNKNYTLIEYKAILKKYNDKNKYPNLN